MARLLAAWLRWFSQLSQSEKLEASAGNEAVSEDLPPLGCGLLYHMDVKGGVHNLRKLEEVGISCVGSTASKDTLEKNF